MYAGGKRREGRGRKAGASRKEETAVTRVLRYPRMCALFCVGVLSCAVARDLCVSAGQEGWARVLLVVTLVLLAVSLTLLSCRFFVEDEGVGVGILLRVRRTAWQDLSSLGVLCCNSRRMYLYGLYGSSGFLQMLHRAPQCGKWGFVVPLSRRLISAILTRCPYEVDFSHISRPKPQGGMRMLWHQAALYAVVMLPSAALAFVTGAAMLVRASGLSAFASVAGLTLCACLLFAMGVFLLYRALLAVALCPRIGEQGVRAGLGLYMPWTEIRFGYVHRMGQVSGMFLLSQRLEKTGKRDAPPMVCLSLPDTSTLLLAYLTYCPYAEKGLAQ